MSLGWESLDSNLSTGNSLVLRDAVELAQVHDIPLIASAGNTNGDQPTFPGRLALDYDNLLSINVTNHLDDVTYLSPVAQNEGQITLSAPGGHCEWQVGWDTHYCLRTTNIVNGQNNLYGFAGRTSGATALTAGVAALVWSTNKSLTSTDIKLILEQTADKVGNFNYNANGWHNKIGYGRINALKAVYRAQRLRAESELSDFESRNPESTAPNQGRRIVHDGTSSHIVFETSGEIAYFKRLSNGTLTTPVLLSNLQDTLIGRNANPSITLSGSTIHAVWQKKRYGYDTYDLVHKYSSNGGSTWSSEAYAASGLQQTWEPVPALAGSVVSWSPHLMLTYRGPDGIHALVYHSGSNLFGPYTSGNSLVLADTSAASPALSASYYNSSTRQHIVWSDGGDSIRYSMFTASNGTWSTPVNLSSIVTGAADHLTPSISGNINGNIHVAWHRSTGSGQYQNLIYHRRKHSSDGTWPNQYAATYYQYQGYPSLKSINSTEAVLAYAWLVGSTPYVWKQAYSQFGTWNTPTQLSSSGRHPSVSVYGENRAVWTGGTGSPFDIVVGSSTLKAAPQEPVENVRLLSWRDAESGRLIELTFAQPVLRSNGIGRPLPWIPVDPDSSVTTWNVGRFLRPDLSGVDADDAEVVFDIHVKGITSVMSGFDVRVGLAGRSESRIGVANPDDVDGLSYELAARVTPDVLANGMYLIPEVAGAKDMALGHLLLEPGGWRRLTGGSSGRYPYQTQDMETPAVISLGATPNPFNPSTQIRWTLDAGRQTRLSVYDLLGREVVVLADGHFGAGTHTAIFDGAGLASGIYMVRLQAGGTVRTVRITLMK